LKEMVKLQEDYECFFFVADWHALTTEYADPKALRQNTEEMIVDWLAAGLDPQKAVIYRQSDLPEVAELALYFGFVTPLSWLERNPTYKEQLREVKGRELATYGFIGYPVLQTADILIVRAELVPVGEDQLPHLELSREIARRFNYFYGDFFPEPQAILSKAQRLPGLDGRKMSKSYGNAINLSDSPEVIKRKVGMMITDPQRKRKTDPGRPEVCSVFTLHRLYSVEDLGEIAQACRGALRGCVECKIILAERIIESLEPFQLRRKEILGEKGYVKALLMEGAKRVSPIAQETLNEVRKRLNLHLNGG
jgi:tryptophanyl-tRNA synthetase